MAITAGLNGQEIAAIASSGVMGVATLFMATVAGIKGPAAKTQIWAAVAVVSIAAFVQVGTVYMQQLQIFRSNVSVSLSPDTQAFTRLLPQTGAPLSALPRLWLDSGAPQCNPKSPQFNPQAIDCLAFTQSFELADRDGTIYVSVDAVVDELTDRLQRLKNVIAVQGQLALTQDASLGGAASPVGEDDSVTGEVTP